MATYLQSKLAFKTKTKKGNIHETLNRLLVDQSKSLVRDLRHQLDRIALLEGHDPTQFTRADHLAIREQELTAIDVPAPVRQLLLNPDKNLPDLFEACIGHAVARMAADDPGLSVAAVI
jgi:hypothetical protein